MKTTIFVSQLPKEAQEYIKKTVYNTLLFDGYRGKALSLIVGNAMCERLCNLSERVLELGKLREAIKLTREYIENEIKFWSEPPKAKLLPSVKAVKDGKVNSYRHCLEILDSLIESEAEE